MNGHPLNPHRLSRPILFIHLDLLDLCQSPQTLVPQQLPKYGVQPVQVRCGGEGDEKLAAVGVGPFVGHADDAAIVVPQPRSDLIVEGPAPDGATALGIIRGIGMRRSTRLSHESRDDTVEGRAVVVIGGAEGKEILIGRDLVSGGYCGREQGKDAGHRGGRSGERQSARQCNREAVRPSDIHTSAVLGTLSQKTSILRSPRVVCSVTDMAGVSNVV